MTKRFLAESSLGGRVLAFGLRQSGLEFRGCRNAMLPLLSGNLLLRSVPLVEHHLPSDKG